MQNVVGRNQIAGNDIGLLEQTVYFCRTLMNSFCNTADGKDYKFQYFAIHNG